MKNHTKYKVLLLENISQVAVQNLKEAGHEVDLLDYAPAKEELIKTLRQYDVVGLRSKSKMTDEVIKANPHLKAIGCFCIGTNQVNLEAARGFGIPVFNAPHSNTRSVAELVIAEMIALSRKLGDISSKAHQGIWQKSAVGSNEVRGKTLGIVGYGHIGSQVSILAESMGLNVRFYDIAKKLPLGNAKAVNNLPELLGMSDFVSLHVPALQSTENLITKKQLSEMKKGAYLINASRGTVVVIEDLVSSLKSKHIAGCAIDVFPSEPASNADTFSSPLQGLDNVILTPHIGGSTEEAQVSIGEEVSDSLINFLHFGISAGAVNFPNVDIQPKETGSRLTNVHRNEPGVLGEINSIISESGANIGGQSLATNDEVGYIIIDVETEDVEELARKVKNIDKNIITRVVY